MSEVRALITGVTGQDGSYLADQLLAEGLHVFGMARRHAGGGHWRLQHLTGHERFRLVEGELTDPSALARLVGEIRPRFVYNLAAQSFVPYSWQAPGATAQATALGVLNLLEAVRQFPTDGGGAPLRFYQASSSEMFGNSEAAPQSESTPFNPRSPYGVSKVFGHNITVNYRESFGLFAVSGILFNHESERRGTAFVTRKVTSSVALIKHGKLDRLRLGNLEAVRDWGYAPDFVAAMRLMLAQDEPRDFVIATGRAHSVGELCAAAFGAAGLDWQKCVEVDPALLRPAELHLLRGDASAARERLGWQPQVGFEQMIERMVAEDLRRVELGIDWEV